MPSAPSHSPDVKYQHRRNCLLQWFGGALGLLAVLFFISPLLFSICWLTVTGMAGFFIFDSLKRNTHFHKSRDEGTLAGLKWWGTGLFVTGMVCWLTGIGLLLLDESVLGGYAHEEPRIFTFATPPLERAVEGFWQLLGLAGVSGLLVFGFLLWAWWRNIKEQRTLGKLAAANTLVFLITVSATLWLTANHPSFHRNGSCALRITHTFAASDGQTYSLLQSKGDSSHGVHSVIARHIGSSMLTERLQTVTPYYGAGDVKAVLRQGLTEADPKVRKLCRTLLSDLK